MNVSKKNAPLRLYPQSPPPYREEKLLETIRLSREAFYAHELQRPLSPMEFLFWQSRYIRKRWWIVQAALLLLLWSLLRFAHSGFYVQRCVGSFASVFVLLALPELWKNRSRNALEVEGTTLYSLRQIYGARLLLFAMADLLFISLFFAVSSFTVKIALEELIIQFFLPFQVTCCICFRSLYSRSAGTEALALLLGLLWIAVWSLIIIDGGLYEAISLPVWALLLTGTFLYLIYCVLKLQKNCEKIWEEQPLWN